ncbi:expressed unknown protein [Seminavis robusta]|uniref:Uncharacterized protein n=1 Tax=Seminavis robusta TaxID=568900 RepID=A0A9N8EMK1_9STRA|nr:expressed unknown protein [Seminavis robusta]|eukprot:Sro1233_g254760.1 n/a (620) ;mRNA; f:5712-7919
MANMHTDPSFHRSLFLEQTFIDSPRFGHSNKFSHLFNDARRDDYLIGISTVALILACIFLCWLLFLLMLKCCGGKSRVGFLSGAQYDATTPTGDVNRRPTRGRVVFGLSAIGMITFTMLMVFLGLPGLENMSSDLSDGADLGADILRDGETATGAFVAGSRRILATRDVAVESLKLAFRTGKTIAPAAEIVDPLLLNSTATTNATNATESSPNHLNFAVQNKVRRVLDSLEAINETAQKEGSDLIDTLEAGEERFRTLSDSLDDVDLMTLQISMGVGLILLPFVLLLIMIAVASGVKNSCLQCFTFFLIPLFVALILFLLIMTALAAISGILNADFCHSGFDNTHDSTLLEILTQSGSDRDSFAFRSTTYVLRNCVPPTEPIAYPLDFMEAFETKIRVAVENVATLSEEIETLGVEKLSQDLKFDVASMQEELATFEERVAESIETVGYALADLGCERLREIYDIAIGEAICDYTGVLWTFFSFLAMTFFACLMLTFRAVLFPVSSHLPVVGSDELENSAKDKGEEDDSKDSEGTGTGAEPSADEFMDEPEGDEPEGSTNEDQGETERGEDGDPEPSPEYAVPVIVKGVGFDEDPDPSGTGIVVIPQPPGAEFDCIIWV